MTSKEFAESSRENLLVIESLKQLMCKNSNSVQSISRNQSRSSQYTNKY